MKNKIIVLILILIPLVIKAQHVEIKGSYKGNKIDFNSSDLKGFLNVHDIKIYFPTISILNIEGIDIKHVNYNMNNNYKTFSIVKEAKSDNEIQVELNIEKTCGGDINCERGTIKIIQLNDSLIEAKGHVISEVVQSNLNDKSMIDTLFFNFRTYLFNTIPQLAESDSNKQTEFSFYKLSGQVKNEKFLFGTEFKNIEPKGYAILSLESIQLELNHPDTEFPQELQLEIWSPFFYEYEPSHKNRLDRKLKVGKYSLLPYPEIKSKEDFIECVKALGDNQIYAQIDDDELYEDVPVYGTLIIDYISMNRIKGSFDIKFKETDDSESYLNSKFDIPLETR